MFHGQKSLTPPGFRNQPKAILSKCIQFLSQLAYFRSENSHGQCSNCSIRSYYIWCLFSSLIHYMWNQPYCPSSCLDLPWCTSESGSTESQHSPVTDCVGQGTHLSVRQAVCRTQRNPLNSVPFFFIMEAFFLFFFFFLRFLT